MSDEGGMAAPPSVTEVPGGGRKEGIRQEGNAHEIQGREDAASFPSIEKRKRIKLTVGHQSLWELGTRSG